MADDHTNVPSARDDRRPLADRVKDLDGFVPELRERLNRGEYANCGPVNLGELSPFGDPEKALRIMLADWDHFENLTPEQRDDYGVAARRLRVLADLDAFRQRLDGRQGDQP